MRKYDQPLLDPAAEIVGRRTLSSLVFGAVFGAALGAAAATPGAVCVPAEWTESKTAASASVTSSVSKVHSGNGHLYFFAIRCGLTLFVVIVCRYGEGRFRFCVKTKMAVAIDGCVSCGVWRRNPLVVGVFFTDSLLGWTCSR